MLENAFSEIFNLMSGDFLKKMDGDFRWWRLVE